MRFSRRGKDGQPSFFPSVFFLTLFFVSGVFLGRFFAGHMSVTARQELAEYLQQYVRLESQLTVQTMTSTLILYLRYPLMAVLLGFASIGIALIPTLAVVFGFFTSFSVFCFVATLGTDGVWLSLAAFGLRCAITLPCFLMLASSSWENAGNLAALSFGRGRRVSPIVYGRVWWMRVGICLAVLLLGVCVDLMLVPFCIQWVLTQVLF